MKILYVVHQFFPRHITGTERLTLQLARQMQKMGNFVSVLTYEPDKKIEGFERLDSNVMKKEYLYETIPVISFKMNNPMSDFHIFDNRLEKYLPEIIKKFDVVHITHPMRLGIIVKACKELGKPIVLTLTDNWLLCPLGLLTKDLQLCDGPSEGKKCMSVCNYDEKILSRYADAKFLFETVDKIFTGCEFITESFGINNWKKEMQVNTFSVDYSYIKPEKETPEIVFGFIGSLIWQKGVHVLIEAFRKVENKKIKLKIYGSTVEGDDTHPKLVSLRGDDSRIEFCGTFDYQDLPKIMKEISVIVIPSTYKEIYPLVMQLGFAYKKPIIATRVGGLPEGVKDEINGYLFDVGNVEQLSEIISKIAENPELIVKLKQNITDPPSVEEEAFPYEIAYKQLLSKTKY